MTDIDDRGFTLVELIITIVIMGVIITPIANLIVSYFANTATTTGRLNESHDEQIAAAYLAQDIATVGTRDQTTLALQPSIWAGSFPAGSCGSAVSAANQILLIKSDDVSWNTAQARQDTTVDSVAYVKVLASSGDTELHRLFCSGSTQQSNVVVTHNLNTTMSPNPAVTCSSICNSSTVPSTVSLTVAVRDRSGSGQPYTMTLSGQRRQS